jgi:2-desacetyl-2-hydroxyethyl bacteriochlorophyllide A dehydrogenase
MKAVVVRGEKKLSVEEVPKPEASAGEILIKITHCLLCTWEMRIFTGASSMKVPFIPGHEASGIVDSVPEGTVTSFKEGDRVVFKTLDHCGHCTYCYSGKDNQCTGAAKKRFYGDIPGSGGLAQYIALEPARVFPFPGDAPLEAAAFTEPLACCIHSVERGRIEFGETVVVIGAGIMGQLHLILARLRGGRCIVVEPREDRRALAMELGAFGTIDPVKEDCLASVMDLTGGEGTDVVFLTAPDPALAELSISLARKTGRVVFYGSFHPNRPIAADPNGIHYSEVIITGSSGPATGDFLKASRLIAHGTAPVLKLLTRLYPIDQAEEAFKAALSPDSYRVGITLD